MPLNRGDQYLCSSLTMSSRRILLHDITEIKHMNHHSTSCPLSQIIFSTVFIRSARLSHSILALTWPELMSIVSFLPHAAQCCTNSQNLEHHRRCCMHASWRSRAHDRVSLCAVNVLQRIVLNHRLHLGSVTLIGRAAGFC